MNLLVYEHASGGGFAGTGIPPDILSEGYGMLRTLITDLKAAGHRVATLLDSRLAAYDPPIGADTVIPISSSMALDECLKRLSSAADAAYVIAPETGGVLRGLVERVEGSGVSSLNSEPRAIAAASDKAAVLDRLWRAGLRVPDTRVLDLGEGVETVERASEALGFPFVLKPADGVGCAGLSLVERADQVEVAARKAAKASSDHRLIAQRLVKGTAASASVLSTGREAAPLTLNRQKVVLATPDAESSYNGGLVPLAHPGGEEALEAARKAVASFPGLRGYVGVDLVLAEEGPVVIEVNPRLTTSYIGLRRVVGFNPAQAVIDAVLRGRLPEKVESSGFASFSKVKVPSPPVGALGRVYGMSGVITPPFPAACDTPSYALLLSKASSPRDADAGLRRTRRRLLEAIARGAYG